MEMKPVDSSNVDAIGYDEKAKEIHVQFKSGGTYAYSNAEPHHHKALIEAPSIGKHIHGVLKAKHPVRKVK